MGTLDEILATRETAPAQEATQDTTTQAAPETEAAELATEQQPEGQEGGEQSTKDGKPPIGAIRQAEREKATKRYTEQVADFDKRLADTNAAWERRFETLVQTLGPKQEPRPAPDIFENPAGFVQHQTQPLQVALQEQREQFSQILAVEKFGQETVAAAYSELEKRFAQNPQAAQADHVRIMRSPHPYAALVQWHRQIQAQAEIGDDPAAYKERVKAELLAELGAQQPDAQAETVTQQRPVMPSNLTTARNVGSRAGPVWGGPAPLADIFARKR